MEKTFLGAEVLRRLKYASEAVEGFLEGHVALSLEPFSPLFSLSSSMASTVSSLFEKGYVVYAVIHGTYAVRGDKMWATTYLCLQ